MKVTYVRTLVKTPGRCLRSDMIWLESRAPSAIGGASGLLEPLTISATVEDEFWALEGKDGS